MRDRDTENALRAHIRELERRLEALEHEREVMKLENRDLRRENRRLERLLPPDPTLAEVDSKRTRLTLRTVDEGRKVVATLRRHRGQITIGRTDSLDCVIDDPGVSRLHATIDVDGDITLTDCGSTSGTFVNGERIETRKLAHRDEITVGSKTLVAFIHDAAQPEVDDA